jgi:hypothetical protein
MLRPRLMTGAVGLPDRNERVARVARALRRVDARLLLTLLLMACSESDTVIALTVNSADPVGQVNALRVTVTQAGEAPYVTEIVPPSETTDAGTRIKPSFFERVILPVGWASGTAVIEVSAQNVDAVAFNATTMTMVRAEGAVAAAVMLGENPPPPNMDAGVDDDAGATP